MSRRRLGHLILIGFALACAVSVVSAQRWFREGADRAGSTPTRFRPADLADSRFAFCKLMYDSVRWEQSGIGWSTDYPYAGINLMTRLSELTKTTISRDEAGDVNHWVVRLTDPGLFDCPFVMATDVGTVGLSGEEAQHLNEYLLKGGFLWVDDFWGERAWTQWEQEIEKALPRSQYPIVDIPPDHPVLRTFFALPNVPQVTNIRFWRFSRGRVTSERGEETQDVHFRGIADRQGRLMVIMTHNTDIGDSWEREGEDPEFFHQFAPDGYALAMDVLVYAMTH